MEAAARTVDGASEARRRLAVAIRSTKPPPKIKGSEWADQFRFIPKGSASEHGKWDTDRAPYQREILDAACDSSIPAMVLMTASQVGKTEIINNTIGYHIDQDPCPILAVAPTVEMAMAWSKDRVAPTIEETPCLKAKIDTEGWKDSSNTILHKRFAGGALTFVGANAPAGLAQRPIRIVVADDVDRFPASAGAEGDPISLAKRRMATFWNAKSIEASTPTQKGLSRIAESWDMSDQRRFFVPCPRCGFKQVLKWQPGRTSLGYEGEGGVVYKKDDNGRRIPGSARYKCGECLEEIEESEKLNMLRAGEWVALKPENHMRGYHVSAIYSPWVTWEKLVSEWDECHETLASGETVAKPEKLKTFVNTGLGEPWEEGETEIDVDILRARQEVFAAQVPNGVGILVAAVDVQGDRLEMIVKGYGDAEESWTIDYLVFRGDPGHGAVWADLDRALVGTWQHESGRKIKLSAVTIDSGGHHSDEVYKFCALRSYRRVFAIKGMGGPRQIVDHPTKVKGLNSKLFIIGVDPAKDRIWSRLKISKPDAGVPRAGYIHLGADLTDDYLEGLLSERPLRKWVSGKGWRRVWTKVESRTRNEPWDLEVYALAGLYLLGSGTVKRLAEKAKELAVPVDDGVEVAVPRRPARKRSGWMGGVRK